MSLPSPLPWREVAQQAACAAALAEARSKAASEVHFNYRWEHVQAVVRLALRLAELTGADPAVVEAAAWLHDIAKGQSRSHGPDGAAAARQILATTDLDPERIERAADAIAKHVGLWRDEPVTPLEAAVLWDADKLSKLGMTAVLHFTGAAITSEETSTADLVARLPGSGWQERTVASLHTEPARVAGLARWAAYQDFCRRAAQELAAEDL